MILPVTPWKIAENLLKLGPQDGKMAELAEGASLLRTYRTKSYREFESRSSRWKAPSRKTRGFF